jgi:ribosomal protein S18 acetylase RimI-like enzyme
MSQVALSGGAVVGAVLCGHDGRRGYLTHLAVAESHRMAGIGRALVAAAVAALERENVAKCHILVMRENSAAQAFWSECGWTRRGELDLMSLFTEPDDGSCC